MMETYTIFVWLVFVYCVGTGNGQMLTVTGSAGNYHVEHGVFEDGLTWFEARQRCLDYGFDDLTAEYTWGLAYDGIAQKLQENGLGYIDKMWTFFYRMDSNSVEWYEPGCDVTRMVDTSLSFSPNNEQCVIVRYNDDGTRVQEAQDCAQTYPSSCSRYIGSAKFTRFSELDYYGYPSTCSPAYLSSPSLAECELECFSLYDCVSYVYNPWNILCKLLLLDQDQGWADLDLVSTSTLQTLGVRKGIVVTVYQNTGPSASVPATFPCNATGATSVTSLMSVTVSTIPTLTVKSLTSSIESSTSSMISTTSSLVSPINSMESSTCSMISQTSSLVSPINSMESSTSLMISPTSSMESQTNSMEPSTSSLETLSLTESPTRSIESPTSSIESQTSSMESSVSMESPTISMESPTSSFESSTSSMTSPSNSMKSPTSLIESLMFASWSLEPSNTISFSPTLEISTPFLNLTTTASVLTPGVSTSSSSSDLSLISVTTLSTTPTPLFSSMSTTNVEPTISVTPFLSATESTEVPTLTISSFVSPTTTAEFSSLQLMSSSPADSLAVINVTGFSDLVTGSRYRIYMQPVSWYEAEEICKLAPHFGSLASFQTFGDCETNTITSILRQNQVGSDSSFWLKAFRESDSSDVWYSSDYNHSRCWTMSGHVSDQGGQCAYMHYAQDGHPPKLRSADCSERRPFVCVRHMGQNTTNFTSYTGYDVKTTPANAEFQTESASSLEDCMDSCRAKCMCIGATYRNTGTNTCELLMTAYGWQYIDYSLTASYPEFTHFVKQGSIGQYFPEEATSFSVTAEATLPNCTEPDNNNNNSNTVCQCQYGSAYCRAEERSEERWLEEAVRTLEQALLVNKTSTSRHRRRRESATDERQSSQTIGTLAVAFMSVCLSVVAVPDAVKLISGIWKAVKPLLLRNPPGRL